MKSLVPALALILLTGAAPASAASLCNCCATGTTDACKASCESVKPAEGMCLPAVDFGGTASVAPGQNPLYDVPLRDLHFSGVKAGDLEAFRELMEMARKGVESDRKQALRDHAGGKIDNAAAVGAAKRYDDAIVNYFLGMHAYRDAEGTK